MCQLRIYHRFFFLSFEGNFFLFLEKGSKANHLEMRIAVALM